MSRTNPLKWKLVAATAGLFLIVGLIALALKLELLATPKPPPNGSRQTVVFPDGGKLEILGVSVGERVVEISRPKWFFLRSFSSKGSSGGTWGGLNVNSESEDGNVIRSRLRSDSTAAMLMEFRMTESSGREMRLSSYLTQRQLVGQDERISGKRGSLGFFEPKDDRLPTLRAEMVKAGLYVLIQHQDPQGGWINFMGPSMYHEPWPGRYIAALTAWQRDLPTLAMPGDPGGRRGGGVLAGESRFPEIPESGRDQGASPDPPWWGFHLDGADGGEIRDARAIIRFHRWNWISFRAASRWAGTSANRLVSKAGRWRTNGETW